MAGDKWSHHEVDSMDLKERVKELREKKKAKEEERKLREEEKRLKEELDDSVSGKLFKAMKKGIKKL